MTAFTFGGTSGTVGVQNLDLISLITIAVRRCGRLPGSLNAEDLQTAQNAAFLCLSSLVNQGVPLWTIEKIVLGINLNQYLLPFPPGTIDVRNVLYRYNVLPSGGTPASSAGGNAAAAFDNIGLTPCVQTAPNGNISYNFGQSVLIPFVGFLNNSTETLSPVWEWSNDGITWTQMAAGSNAGGQTGSFGAQPYVAGQWYWQDIAQPVSAQYFRLRETGGGILNVMQVVFGQPAREVTISRSNADDYQNLPYKNQVGGNGRPLQYWFDRQIQPQMWLWPSSGYIFNSLVCYARRMIQDVGNLTDILEVPTRWLDAICADLASRLSYELQGVQPARVQALEMKAAKALQIAQTEERDDSPVLYQVNIGPYTRGGR
jgi:hypothetical protein